MNALDNWPLDRLETVSKYFRRQFKKWGEDRYVSIDVKLD